MTATNKFMRGALQRDRLGIGDYFDRTGYLMLATIGVAEGGGPPYETTIYLLSNESSHFLIAIGNDASMNVKLLASAMHSGLDEEHTTAVYRSCVLYAAAAANSR